MVDEYDQPIMSSYEYHDEVGTFFPDFYGKALKGNPHLGQALLTGIEEMDLQQILDNG